MQSSEKIYTDISIVRVLNAGREMNEQKVRVGGFLGMNEIGQMCLAISPEWHKIKGNSVDKIVVEGGRIDRLRTFIDGNFSSLGILNQYVTVSGVLEWRQAKSNSGNNFIDIHILDSEITFVDSALSQRSINQAEDIMNSSSPENPVEELPKGHGLGNEK